MESEFLIFLVSLAAIFRDVTQLQLRDIPKDLYYIFNLFFLADFEFCKAEEADREQVVKNLEEYIHELYPGLYFENS